MKKFKIRFTYKDGDEDSMIWNEENMIDVLEKFERIKNDIHNSYELKENEKDGFLIDRIIEIKEMR